MVKVKRLDKAINFGSYRNFTWDSAITDDFKHFNLIYGWNYSGKTSLSRVFALLQQPALREEFSGFFEVTIEQPDSHEVTIDSRSHQTALPIRVFNSDFVRANFEQEHNAPAVHILGESVRFLREEIRKRNQQIERQKEIIKSIESQQAIDKTKVNQKKTDFARIIDAVIDSRYNRSHLEQKLLTVRQNPHAYLLKDSVIESYKKTLVSSGDFKEIPRDFPAPPDIRLLLEKAKILLARSASNQAIVELHKDPFLENWLRAGLKIHQNKEFCSFCGSSLSDSVLSKLNGHFNRELERLRNDINGFLRDELPVEFQVEFPKVDIFLPHLREACSAIWERAIKLKEDFEKQLTTIRIVLEEKLNSGLDRELVLGDQSQPIEDFNALSEDIKVVIGEHNSQVNDTDRLTSQAREKIEMHYIAELCTEVDFTEADVIHASLEKRAIKRRTLITKCIQRIGDLEEEIRRNSVAAERLNDLLKILLPNGNVKAIPFDQSTFEFQRDGSPAKHMSEGEKTAITFAYFLITLEDQGNNKEDLVVFIDDPISSLDSNHIYTVWSLINERLKQCHQLFVSTHNNELFTLIKDEWVNARAQQNFSAEHAGYWISRYADENGNLQSRVEKLPDLLRKYKSEYQFVYSCLHQFAYSPTPSQHEAYTAPNLLRKFLEAYLGFKRPSGGAWHSKLDLLIECPVRRKEIHKFADDASHIQKPARITEHPSYLANAQVVCKEVIEALKAKDRGHFDSLVSLI